MQSMRDKEICIPFSTPLVRLQQIVLAVLRAFPCIVLEYNSLLLDIDMVVNRSMTLPG
jgi:hypothetical protein